MNQPANQTEFARQLEGVLNQNSQEVFSNTPDFILAEYLLACLAAWNRAVQHRETWYGGSAASPSGAISPAAVHAQWFPNASRRSVPQTTAITEHTAHVASFLNELYAVLIDPLAEGEIPVGELCRRLLAQAIEDRESLQRLHELEARAAVSDGEAR